MMVKNKIFLIFMGVFLTIHTSCKKMLEIDSSHVSTEEQQWKSLSDTRSGLIGVYGLMRAALAENNGYWIYGEVRSKDFVPYSRPDLKAVVDNQLTAAFPILE